MSQQLIPWLCHPCGYQCLVLQGDLPPVCPLCKRCLEAVPDNDGVDLLQE